VASQSDSVKSADLGPEARAPWLSSPEFGTSFVNAGNLTMRFYKDGIQIKVYYITSRIYKDDK